MPTFTLTIQGMDKVAAGFDKAGVALPAAFYRAMVASTVAVKQTAQNLVPVRTGALRQSITEIVQSVPLQGTVSVAQPYGKYVEFGTAPHVIEPINKQALAFTAGGQHYVVKRVNHPGTRAQPFLEPSLDSNIPQIQENFRLAAQAALTESFQ